MQRISLFGVGAALFALVMAAGAAEAQVIDPPIFVQQSGTSAAGGDPNLITDTSAFTIGVGGNFTLQDPLLVIVGLIALTALYVAAEFAAVSVRRSRIRQRAEQGDAAALRLLPYLDDPQALDSYIAACQIGITLTSLIIGAYGQASMAGPLAGVIQRVSNLSDSGARSTAAGIILVVLAAGILAWNQGLVQKIGELVSQLLSG